MTFSTRQPLVLALAILTLMAVAAPAQNFTFNLSGTQEVPPVNSPFSGTCAAIALEFEEDDEDFFELSIHCSHDVEDPIAAHIHRGSAGVNGPIVFTFDDPGDLAGEWELSPANLAALLTEDLYMNVHTANNPGGEIRGQLRFQSLIDDEDTQALIVPLGGEQVVPPTMTDADAGGCLVSIDNVSDPDAEVTVICHHSVVDPIAAHIHQGPPGTNGPIVIDLEDPISPIFLELEARDLPENLPEELLGGDFYVQIHSANHPSGEIRGQLAGCSLSRDTLCLDHGRFQVEVTWKDFAGNTGRGTAVRETPNAGMFWFFSPDNTEVLVKVLDACNLEPFNSYWVFFAATTNVELTLTVTDTLSGEAKTYGSALGTAAEPVLDTRAFSTCP